MRHQFCILLDQEVARRTAGAGAEPDITATQCNDLALAPSFIEDEDGLVVSVDSARCVILECQGADTLLLDSVMDEEGEGDDLRRVAEWAGTDVDNDNLREFLKGVCPQTLIRQAWCEVEWVLGGKTARASFPIQIKAALFLPETPAPPPYTPSSEAWLDANAPRYLPDLTTLTGGTATTLDGRITAGKSKLLVVFYLAGQLQWWRLIPGTDAEDEVNGTVRPDDFDASTNAQIWQRVL